MILQACWSLMVALQGLQLGINSNLGTWFGLARLIIDYDLQQMRHYPPLKCPVLQMIDSRMQLLR